MTYDYDRCYPRDKVASATLLKRESIAGSTVTVKTYEAYGGARKTHAVRRFYVVEWGLGRRDETSSPFERKGDAMAFANEKAESLKVVYAVGDIIDGFGRGTGSPTQMQALVKERKVVKNGKPGWVGVLVSSRSQKDPPGAAVWGFDEDIEKRVGRG
jgi:hypothetical protein